MDNRPPDTTVDAPGRTLRETVRFYLIDCRTIPGKLVDLAIIALNLLVCALAVADTYPLAESTRAVLWRIEVAAVSFFIIEYLLRLYGSRSRLRYLYDIYGIIDLVAIVPTLLLMAMPALPAGIPFIRTIRIFRVFRIFRFLRFTADPHFFFGDITILVLRVLRLVVTTFLIFFVGSGFIWLAENPLNDAIATFGDAFYYTVVTVTTVGFGDITPVTGAGRWITLLMILSGIVLIPWQAGQILRELVLYTGRKLVVCPRCGLRYHDRDASHCKACGHVIYQEYDG